MLLIRARSMSSAATKTNISQNSDLLWKSCVVLKEYKDSVLKPRDKIKWLSILQKDTAATILGKSLIFQHVLCDSDGIPRQQISTFSVLTAN